jgi:hypothetical protein
MSLAKTLVIGLGSLSILAGCGKPTPAGYWEGKATAKEVPMKDHFRTLTRGADVDFWFVVEWSPINHTGSAVGEAEAVYEAELKVQNLPKVTAPVPGGSIKFEPEVGGKLTELDPRRKFPIVGVLSLGEDGTGTLVLQKVSSPDKGTAREKLDAEARGEQASDRPLQFTIRADPGVSGGFEGAAGKMNYKDGKVTAETKGGGEFSTDAPDVNEKMSETVIQVPMTPFSPFNDSPAKVEKRPSGPYAASFEEKGSNYSIVWSAKQMGGEKRESPKLTPEMERQIQELKKMLQSKH